MHKGRDLLLFFLLAVCLDTAPCRAQDAPIVDTVLVDNKPSAPSHFDTLQQDLSPFAVRALPDSLVRNIKSRSEYWYADTVPERQKPAAAKDTKKKWFQQAWLGKLLWILLVVLFVGIVAWFLASSNINLFRKKPTALKGDEVGITEEHLLHLSFDNEIEKAVRAQNFRLATRLWYLQTLKLLVDRDRLQFRPGKTNQDYVQQLYGTDLYRDFSKLTRNFEYTWYGRFELGEEAYTVLQKDFVHFKQQLS